MRSTDRPDRDRLRSLLVEARVEPTPLLGAQLVVERLRADGETRTPAKILRALLTRAYRGIGKRRRELRFGERHPCREALGMIRRRIERTEPVQTCGATWTMRSENPHAPRGSMRLVRILVIAVFPRLALVVVGARQVLWAGRGAVGPKQAWPELGAWDSAVQDRLPAWALALEPDRAWLTVEDALAVATGRRGRIGTEAEEAPAPIVRDVEEEASIVPPPLRAAVREARAREVKAAVRATRRYLFPGQSRPRSPFLGGGR